MKLISTSKRLTLYLVFPVIVLSHGDLGNVYLLVMYMINLAETTMTMREKINKIPLLNS